MSYTIGGLFALGLGFVLWSLWLIFSPKFNTTEDYTVLMPLLVGLAIWVLDLVVLLSYGLYRLAIT